MVLLSLLVFSLSCSKITGSSGQNEVVFDDGYKAPAEDEVVFNDNLFHQQRNSTENYTGKSREITQIAKDGSTVEITYDGFGNKTETRTFNGNPMLRLIMLRTGTDGSRKVFVYAKNGEIKTLPDDMLDRILTAPSGELASAAGIYQGISEEPESSQTNQPTTYTQLKPLPSSQFPIRNQQTETTLQQEAAKPSVESEKPQSAGNKQDEIPPSKSTAQISSKKNSNE